MPSVLTTVTSVRQIAAGIFRVEVPLAQPEAHAGCFYMLRREKSAVLLPRAISLCDKTAESLVFLIANVGPGTDELCNLTQKDVLRVTGPLGNGFPLDKLSGKIALVGGGIGIAPLLFTARQLFEKKLETHAFLGFRDEAFLQQAFEACCGLVKVATESGSVGQKGFVTALFSPKEYDAVLCCGPTPMMKAVTQLCMQADVPVYVSLENKMACGIGGCLVCTCADKRGRHLRTCKEGPVFLGEELDFEA